MDSSALWVSSEASVSFSVYECCAYELSPLAESILATPKFFLKNGVRKAKHCWIKNHTGQGIVVS